MKKPIWLVLVGVFLAGCGQPVVLPAEKPVEEGVKNETKPVESEVKTEDEVWVEPMSKASARVTKKPFGIKITPVTSPAAPEKFSGYHTGADWEIFPGEEEAEVLVQAVCDGPLIMKRYVSGYGGAVGQSCFWKKEAVTVLYGHLKLSSITAVVGQNLSAGAQLGVLGRGYSAETDGERKHLHWGVHIGPEIDLRGYVQSASELEGWLDSVGI